MAKSRKGRQLLSPETILETLAKTQPGSKPDPSLTAEVMSWPGSRLVSFYLHLLDQGPYPHACTDSALLRFLSLLSTVQVSFGPGAALLLTAIDRHLSHRQLCIDEQKPGADVQPCLLILQQFLRSPEVSTHESQLILEDIVQKLDSLASLVSGRRKEILGTNQRIREKLNDSEEEPNTKPFRLDEEDLFGAYANDQIDALPRHRRKRWHKLLLLATNTAGNRPTRRYGQQTRPLIDDLGLAAYWDTLREWFRFLIQCKEGQQKEPGGGDYPILLSGINKDTIRGLVWTCGDLPYPDVTKILGQLAERCFRSVRSRGITASSVGNACVYVLHIHRGLEGLRQLSQLGQNMRPGHTLQTIERYIEQSAHRLGVSKEEAEDLVVDDFQLSEGQLSVPIGDYRCILELIGIGKSKLRWIRPNGIEQKTKPSAMKIVYVQELQYVKSLQKSLDQTTRAQRDRLDKMMRSKRTMSLAHFQERYVAHPVMRVVMANLIFTFHQGKQQGVALWHRGSWLDDHGERCSISPYERVGLWHPVNSCVQEVRRWRAFLMKAEIQQPFKQAFREIYLLTEAEVRTSTYSNRMASHILKQQQFLTLARSRQWRVAGLGSYSFDRSSLVSLDLPEYSLRAEYWVSAIDDFEQMSESGTWHYVSTDQVRFMGLPSGEPIPLDNVPRVVFSEVMRDVDLFVGVSSVGNDATWQDSGGMPAHRQYWESYAFGDLGEMAKNRKEILSQLIPRLKLAPVARIEGRFLIVKGKLRTYKIHIGSTNILMEPNDQYLCIVPDRSKPGRVANVFLPFEGDYGLSVIISKAMMLAEDDKIEDSTIRSQLELW